ncbi:SocA family protein [Chryseobacterium sp. L7]|uniref:SocA family protein n=1 Tax=Chryseobacterium endalhagicum TaxID=2797638 RepID=A0ABS1QC58_9FLAO|nr:Panacea domain-containing protein [Chryseobacterium endalhagicum]MBL1219478.1 SocA family protein [Chryseobacterium endalhagicum]
MKNLENLIRYILLHYPNLVELSKPRLVKLIYLIDWRYTIENGEQYTNIKWIYNHYGPYVNDIIDLMRKNPMIFQVESYKNSYEGITDKFSLVDKSKVLIDEKVKKIADRFIDFTYSLKWTDFINLVYSSYPIKNNLKYSSLDLVKLAKDFNDSL